MMMIMMMMELMMEMMMMVIWVILVKISSLQQHPDDPNQREKTTQEDPPSLFLIIIMVMIRMIDDYDSDHDDQTSRIGDNDNCIKPSSLQQLAHLDDPDHLQGIVIPVAEGQPIWMICYHRNNHHLRDHCHYHDRSARAEEPILDLNPFSISALQRNLVVLRTRSSQAAQHFNFVEQKQGSRQWFDPQVCILMVIIFLFLRCIHLLCPR